MLVRDNKKQVFSGHGSNDRLSKRIAQLPPPPELIERQPVCLDNGCPSFDLARKKFGQILWRPTVRRDYGSTDLVHLFLHRSAIERSKRGFAELCNDCRGCCLG